MSAIEVHEDRIIGDARYIVSNDREFISHKFIQSAFDSPDMYWTRPMSLEDIETMVNNSCTLGVFFRGPSSGSIVSSTQVGMARMLTDYVTFAYLTDVYIDPEHRGRGLAKWLMQCCEQMMDQMPELRRCVLLTKGAERFYEKEMGMEVIGTDKNGMSAMAKPGRVALSLVEENEKKRYPG